jgi:hypothetical protein
LVYPYLEPSQVFLNNTSHRLKFSQNYN